MLSHTAAAVPSSARLSTAELQRLRLSCIDYWERVSCSLPHDESHPFHVWLIERMDEEMDLFWRGPSRLSVLLEVVTVVREGATVLGIIAYDQAFERQQPPPPSPLPLASLYRRQQHHHGEILAKIWRASPADVAVLWRSA